MIYFLLLLLFIVIFYLYIRHGIIKWEKVQINELISVVKRVQKESLKSEKAIKMTIGLCSIIKVMFDHDFISKFFISRLKHFAKSYTSQNHKTNADAVYWFTYDFNTPEPLSVAQTITDWYAWRIDFLEAYLEKYHK